MSDKAQMSPQTKFQTHSLPQKTFTERKCLKLNNRHLQTSAFLTNRTNWAETKTCLTWHTEVKISIVHLELRWLSVVNQTKMTRPRDLVWNRNWFLLATSYPPTKSWRHRSQKDSNLTRSLKVRSLASTRGFMIWGVRMRNTCSRQHRFHRSRWSKGSCWNKSDTPISSTRRWHRWGSRTYSWIDSLLRTCTRWRNRLENCSLREVEPFMSFLWRSSMERGGQGVHFSPILIASLTDSMVLAFQNQWVLPKEALQQSISQAWCKIACTITKFHDRTCTGLLPKRYSTK